MAVLITALQAWAVVFALLKALEHFSGGKLSPFLSARDIHLHFCFVSFHTTLLNSPIEALARRRRRPLTYWFSIGVFFGLVGLVLSLLLLSSNVYLTLLDALRPLPAPPPAHPPAYRHPQPPPHTAASAAALARATLRGPSARIPFLHAAPRPWWVPAPLWARIAPRDHSAWHSHALTRAARDLASPHLLNPTRRYSVPYGHADPSAFRRHRRRHRRGPGPGHGPGHGPGPGPGPHHHGRPPPHSGPHPGKKPCRRRHPQTPWRTNADALPAPADRDHRGSSRDGSRIVVPPPGAVDDNNDQDDVDDDEEERDLVQNGDKSEITISWRRKPPQDANASTMQIPSVARFQAVPNASETHHDHFDDGHALPNPGGTHGQQEAPSRSSFLTPLVPGVTVPPGDLWYMIAAVLIAAVVHELGHALAAGMQNARVSGVGGFVALALPGAYVQLTGIEDLSIFAQLRVYCAGAWHNLVAAFVALAAVGWLPLVMSGGYHTSSGALVVSVPELSALVGHVEPGDVILKLGKFDVTDGGPSFRRAVSNLILTNDSVGFCVSEDLYRNFSKPRSTCCDEAVMQNVDMSVEMKHKCFRVEGIERRTSCIDTAVVSIQPTCRATLECSRQRVPRNSGGVTFSRREGPEVPQNGAAGLRLDTVNRVAAPVAPGLPSEGSLLPEAEEDERSKASCFIPVLPQRQQLVDIRVRGARTGETVHFFYQGYPEVLGQSVTVSSYIPRIWYMAPYSVLQAVAILDIPNMIERLLQYLSSISLALAILNMAPVFFLDGEVSSILFVRLFAPRMSHQSAAVAKQVIVCTGSVLLVLNILTSLLEVEAWQS